MITPAMIKTTISFIHVPLSSSVASFSNIPLYKERKCL
jgi:hypothetical protein